MSHFVPYVISCALAEGKIQNYSKPRISYSQLKKYIILVIKLLSKFQYFKNEK